MFNTWEGSYFNISEDKISAIAANAKDIGAEGIVIDDGWLLSVGSGHVGSAVVVQTR